jgi:hypothetical protein
LWLPDLRQFKCTIMARGTTPGNDSVARKTPKDGMRAVISIKGKLAA